MKILMIHKFHYIEGGAERYYFNLSELLRRADYKVIPFAMAHPRNARTPYAEYFVDHFEVEKELASLRILDGMKAAGRVVFNFQAQKRIESLIEATRPDIAHVHGVYHHLSPSVLFSLKKKGLPVIFTLHEYKILCPAYLFLDNQGHVCELCAGRYFWHPIVKKCFRNSYPASCLVSIESYVHRWLRTYKRKVDLYISPSRFLRDKMIRYGYPEEKIEWLPYSIPIDHYQPRYESENYFVYIGRLSREKGITELVRAMKRIPQGKLKVLGQGNLGDQLEKFVESESMKNVEFLGYRRGDELKEIIRNAKFLVMPSVVYDNSPLAIYEAFALGKPVVGAEIGGIPELIDEGKNGFLFRAGDEASLVDAVQKMLSCDKQLPQMGEYARRKAEELFSPEAHVKKILDIYGRYISV